MKRSFSAAALAAGLAGSVAAAPVVVTDIAPVHALAAKVMQGVGAPHLLTPPGASPHGYAMRPSEAAALEDAAVVFWVGEALTPWLETAIDALAGDAALVELASAPGVVALPIRVGATFATHAHDDQAHDDHAHHHVAGAAHDHDHDRDHNAAADAAAHGHGATEADQGHAASADPHGDDHGDEHEGVDPHLWLDPENAKTWLTAMAAALAQADPANAAAYAANADTARAGLDALSAEITATLAPVRGAPFVVFHDAYQYFEARFGMPAAGSVSISDATAPSAARLAEVRGVIANIGAGCLFAEPQFAQGVVEAVAEGAGVRVAVLDPLGVGLELGPALYDGLLRGQAEAMAECLAPRS